MYVLTKVCLESRLHENADTRDLRPLNFHDDVVTAIGNIEKPIATVVSDRLASEQGAAIGVQQDVETERHDFFNVFLVNLDISKQSVATSLTLRGHCMNDQENERKKRRGDAKSGVHYVAHYDEKRSGLEALMPARLNFADVMRRWQSRPLERVSEAKLHHTPVPLNGSEVREVRWGI